MATRPYELVPDRISHDVVEALRTLLALAEKGQMTGIAFGATLKGRRYFTNAAGELYRDPTFARGVVASLDDELGHLVHERASDTQF